MRSFDRVLTGLILWGLLFLGLFWLVPGVSTQVVLDPSYTLVSLVTLFLGLIVIGTYYALYRKEKNQILIELISLKEKGIQVFLDRFELLLYGRDAGDLPRISNLAFNYNARAIVQPRNLEELCEILKLCVKNKIPLIPRAAGTSGYGGVIPIESGIIVNLRDFNKIIGLNREEKTVVVESGVIWFKLLKYLEEEGLTLPCYPSSSLSSTVGGWISQGGYGIGSSKYGSLEEHVFSVTLVDMGGTERTFENTADFIGSYGTLGVITRIKLRVISKTQMKHLAVTADQEKSLFRAAQPLQELIPYFLRFVDRRNLRKPTSRPNIISLESSLPLSGGVLSISFREEDWVPDLFEEIIREHGLTLLSDDWGDTLWKERFYTLRMKRRGPSLIIAEINIPTRELERVLQTLNFKFDEYNYTKEFITNKGGITTILVWFPDDIRKDSRFGIRSISFLFRSLRPYLILRIARQYGGFGYSTGLWYSPYSKSILGPKLERFRILKKQHDPYKLLNPGKIWAPYFPRFFPIIPYSILIRIFIPIFDIILRIFPRKYR
ncbi:MAG: FAD-binding oxidoreductase [Candidatus Heimdallarchaeota archaeon]